MIFAAGRGTRMAALTDGQPKPMIKVAGQPLIDHALALTAPVMPLRRVVNLNYLGGQIEAHLAGSDVLFSHETQALETGGGLRHALPLLGAGPVYTLNSDAVWSDNTALTQLAQHWNPAKMEALLLLVAPSRAIGHKGRGDFTIDAAGRLARGPGYVYSGVQIIDTSRLAAISTPVFSLNKIWDAMDAEKALFGVVYPGTWCDVGQPSSLPLAEALMANAFMEHSNVS